MYHMRTRVHTEYVCTYVYSQVDNGIVNVYFTLPVRVCLQNGSTAVMLACLADFSEVLTALVEEFKLDVMAKDYV